MFHKQSMTFQLLLLIKIYWDYFVRITYGCFPTLAVELNKGKEK